MWVWMGPKKTKQKKGEIQKKPPKIRPHFLCKKYIFGCWMLGRQMTKWTKYGQNGHL